MTPQDDQHLRLLSVFHVVLAVFGALLSLVPVIHLVIGLSIATGRLPADGAPDAAWVGWIFVAMSAMFIVGGLTFSVCLLLAGRYLRQRRHYTFCLVMAALSCMLAPFGTVLGVLTILVLMRESVRVAFGEVVPVRPVAPPPS